MVQFFFFKIIAKETQDPQIKILNKDLGSQDPNVLWTQLTKTTYRLILYITESGIGDQEIHQTKCVAS